MKDKKLQYYNRKMKKSVAYLLLIGFNVIFYREMEYLVVRKKEEKELGDF
jgi:hypothetical protein